MSSIRVFVTGEKVVDTIEVESLSDFTKNARFFFRQIIDGRPTGVHIEIKDPLGFKEHYEKFRNEDDTYFKQQLNHHRFCYKKN